MSFILIFLACAVIANILIKVVSRANGVSIEYVESESDRIIPGVFPSPAHDDAYGRVFRPVIFEVFEDDDDD